MLLTEIALKALKTHLEYHDKLNPKLWDGMQMKDDVKSALKEIANSFLVALKAPKESVVDVILTGSNANYNWSRLSDVDLHVILDYSKICNDCEGDGSDFDLDDCFKAKKTLWNDGHDVTIKGHDVEVYAQDKAELPSGNAGIYSLVKDTWVREPTKEENLVYDEKEIKVKAKKLMDEIDAIINDGNTNETTVKNLQDKIKKMRQASISKGGEFSLENLVFKTLRNNGYMEKLYDFGNKLNDKDLSLK
jgi:hypothetical protein